MEKAGTKGYTFLNLDDPPPYEPPGNDGQRYQPCRNYRQPYPGQQPDEGQLQCIIQQQYGLQPYGEPTHVQSPTTATRLAAAAGEMEAAKIFSRKARNFVISSFVFGVMWFGIATAIIVMNNNKNKP
ncbi:hypothetical protein MAR_033130 [Mya arenaria]|uniref:Transmembrane protein n=1 Tax=Mya arenaria TaxID=6604 RepID=A0ABY7G842_MYAAR|nr:uncharacterized protein LOC128222833 [Mya arenaria]WAR30588.1 hypothetical protein MAR_033130 [Mya arenaria]